MPWISQAVQASPCDGWTVDDVVASVRCGSAALWVAVTDRPHGICLTELVPERSAARIVMLSGERMQEWLRGIGMIEAWALAWGCGVVEVPGRQGWARLLRPHGYAISGGELRKRL